MSVINSRVWLHPIQSDTAGLDLKAACISRYGHNVSNNWMLRERGLSWWCELSLIPSALQSAVAAVSSVLWLYGSSQFWFSLTAPINLLIERLYQACSAPNSRPTVTDQLANTELLFGKLQKRSSTVFPRRKMFQIIYRNTSICIFHLINDLKRVPFTAFLCLI